MTVKKTAAAVTVAIGMTVAVAASSASSATDSDGAASPADKTQIELSKSVAKTAANEKSGESALRCGKKAASLKETKKLNVYMPLKKAQRILGSKGRKVSGNKLRAWNTCYEEYSDLYLHNDKRKGKWYVYTVSAPIRG
ncbi:hypothetical protein [Solicola gregarius]|uniref:Secreted protein n=1 Tax=Solicola gregarius TaxID=2908642 RepID=A0AA46TGR1_9ACTN|nr:hypothetical protein [Solicola gregarius]UYM04534.1 hypothetical protein L0C25_18655 [Solicola gregarius]